MKTSTTNIVLAAGALAQLASAQPHLGRREEVTVTDIDYTTAIVYVTAGAPSASTVVAASAVKSAHSRLHHWHHKSSSTAVASSSSEAASASSSSSPSANTAASYSTSASPFTTFSIPADSSSTAATASSSSSSALPVYSSSAYGSSSAAASSSSSALPVYSSSGYGSSTSSAGPSAYSSSTTSAGPSAYPSSSTSSAAAPTGTSSGGGFGGYSGIKAGLSGYVGCESQAGFQSLAPYIGWYSDYAANTTGATTTVTPNVNGGTIQGIPMLWGDGISCSSVSTGRLQGFENAVSDATEMPIMFGLYEPDCDCDMSSGISDVSQGVSDWNKYLAPLKEKFGTTLGSPSMCKQKDETWLSEFYADSSKPDWDVTSIHINVNNMDDLKADVDYYVRTFGKPVWVSEFACVQGVPWTPCSDQGIIDQFIEDAVTFFQGNDSVVAYGPSNGEGLGDTWPLFDSDTHELSATGQKYLDVIKALQY